MTSHLIAVRRRGARSFEPCESELQYLTRVQYDRAFTDAMRLHYRGVKRLIVHLTGAGPSPRT